ncbi:PTS lactose/cellobiose transporter subunit IIA [Dethiothermospora halolimnae]|uniref:PTS lactose/cellobiose transporter subunit IIA n=1 Tax=Dethiothermospora halolimnae TaxID=3114390 RepID=UPI003CCBD440
MELEQIIFKIITYSGNAKSSFMEAIQHAKKGEIDKLKNSIESGEEDLKLAHKEQTKLIQNEADGGKVETSLLLIHAQDHLMNAITIKDLAMEIVELYKKITE